MDKIEASIFKKYFWQKKESKLLGVMSINPTTVKIFNKENPTESTIVRLIKPEWLLTSIPE